MGGIQRFNLSQRCLVVPLDPDFSPRVNLSDPLHEIEGERIVIVEQKNHDQFHTVDRLKLAETAIATAIGSHSDAEDTTRSFDGKRDKAMELCLPGIQRQ